MEARIRTMLQDCRVAVAVITIMFLCFRNQRHWAGFWLGLLVGVVNWRGLSHAAERAVWLSVTEAQRYMVRSYVLRYGMRLVVLALGFIFYDLHPLTLLAGLTAPTAVAIISYNLEAQSR